MAELGHPDHCSLCKQRHDERVQEAMRRVLKDNRELFEALAPHDTRDPNRPGWMLCGCCQHPLP